MLIGYTLLPFDAAVTFQARQSQKHNCITQLCAFKYFYAKCIIGCENHQELNSNRKPIAFLSRSAEGNRSLLQENCKFNTIFRFLSKHQQHNPFSKIPKSPFLELLHSYTFYWSRAIDTLHLSFSLECEVVSMYFICGCIPLETTSRYWIYNDVVYTEIKLKILFQYHFHS